jgi:hypothetical protein
MGFVPPTNFPQPPSLPGIPPFPPIPSIPPIPTPPLDVDLNFGFGIPPLAIPKPTIPGLPSLPAIPIPPLPDSLGAGLGASVPATPLICNFAIPAFAAAISGKVKLPKIPFPPSIFLALGLPCDIGAALAISFGPGGGRPNQQQTEPFWSDP